MTVVDNQIQTLLNNDNTFDQGFSMIVSEYQERLYWHIRRMLHDHDDTDDVLQNTFIKIFKGIKGFKWEAKLYTWIFRIGTNEAISFLNKKKSNLSLEDNMALANLYKEDPHFDAEHSSVLLKEAIEQLPPKQRVVFNMRYYDEVSYADMSEILKTSQGALKASYHHAAKKIQDYLIEKMNYVQG